MRIRRKTLIARLLIFAFAIALIPYQAALGGRNFRFGFASHDFGGFKGALDMRRFRAILL